MIRLFRARTERYGLQHQCIVCAACADVCDPGDEAHRPSEGTGALHHPERGRREGDPYPPTSPAGLRRGPCRSARRVATSFVLRIPVDLDVLRDRNVYPLKIVTMDDRLLHWRVSASGIGGLRLDAEGADLLLDMRRTAHDVWRAARLLSPPPPAGRSLEPKPPIRGPRAPCANACSWSCCPRRATPLR